MGDFEHVTRVEVGCNKDLDPNTEPAFQFVSESVEQIAGGKHLLVYRFKLQSPYGCPGYSGATNSFWDFKVGAIILTMYVVYKIIANIFFQCLALVCALLYCWCHCYEICLQKARY